MDLDRISVSNSLRARVLALISMRLGVFAWGERAIFRKNIQFRGQPPKCKPGRVCSGFCRRTNKHKTNKIIYDLEGSENAISDLVMGHWYGGGFLRFRLLSRTLKVGIVLGHVPLRS